MGTVGFVAFGTSIEYLWQNVIGAVVVVLVGVPLSRFVGDDLEGS